MRWKLKQTIYVYIQSKQTRIRNRVGNNNNNKNNNNSNNNLISKSTLNFHIGYDGDSLAVVLER